MIHQPSELKTSELQIEEIGAALSQVLGDLGLEGLRLEAEDTSPVILRDLQANASELIEICQVLSERSLNRTQLDSLANLELAILTLDQRVQDFVSLI